MTRTPTIFSENEGWGYFNAARSSALLDMTGNADSAGTDTQNQMAHATARDAFARVVAELVSAKHFKNAEKAREFLDSRYGRHLGDDIGHDKPIAACTWLPKAVRQYRGIAN